MFSTHSCAGPLSRRYTRLRATAALGTALCTVVGTGCYAYMPVPRGTVLPGRPVELTLSDSGTLVVARSVGPAAEAVRGTLAADSAGSYVLAVQGVRRRNGADEEWGRERLAVPRVLVTGVAERSLARTRTVIFGAGVVAAVVLARALFGGNGGSNAGAGPGGSGGPK